MKQLCEILLYFYRYSLMLNCWQFNPHKRAQFPETVQKLDKILSMAVDQVDNFKEVLSLIIRNKIRSTSEKCSNLYGSHR